MIQVNQRTIKSVNYEVALIWVRERYSFLFHDGIFKIELVKSNPKWLGLHTFTMGQSHIRIASQRQNTVADYVSTIVHELVHALQYKTHFDILPVTLGGLSIDSFDWDSQHKMMEKQAEDLSTEAYITYKKDHNIPIWA